MKKVFILVLFSSILLIVNGCMNSISTNDNVLKDIEIGWIFEVSTKIDDNGTEVPYTNVSLLINGEKTEIETVLGYPEGVNDFESLGMPKDSIMAFSTWFGGAGVDIYIKKMDEKTLGIMWRYVDESDGNLQDFIKMKEIEFPVKISIKTIEAKVIYN